MRFFRAVTILLWKEIRIELRTKELLYSSLLFAAIIVLIFSFSFLGVEPPTKELQAGLLWISLSFVGLLSIHRCFMRELEGDMFRALLLTPAPRFSIYIAKFLSMLLLMGITMVWIIPLLIFFLELKVVSWLWLGIILFLGMAGFVAVACLFAARLEKTQHSTMLLSVLVYPLIIPVLIAGVQGTHNMLCDSSLSLLQCNSFQLENGVWQETLRWIRFLGIFDFLVLMLSAWIFEPLCATD